MVKGVSGTQIVYQLTSVDVKNEIVAAHVSLNQRNLVVQEQWRVFCVRMWAGIFAFGGGVRADPARNYLER